SRSGSVEAASVLPMKDLQSIVKTMHTPRTLRLRGAPLDRLLVDAGLEPESCDLLNLDVQGAELSVLRGASRALPGSGALICEVSRGELYEGGASEAQIEDFARQRGFGRAATIYHRYYDDQGWFVAWGEVLFARELGEARA